jgi:diguanylate cyclase (GGDEF)-like protein/PAS domain S-box-containing protein
MNTLHDIRTSHNEANRHLAALVDDHDLYNHFPECVKLVCNRAGLSHMNQMGLTLFGAASVQDLQSQAFETYFTESYREEFLKLREQVFKGQLAMLECQLLGLSGQSMWLDLRASPIFDKDGAAIALFAIARNITKKKNIEQALFESEQRLRSLIETIPQQIWTADPTGQLSFVNQRTTEYFGVTAEQVLGSSWKHLVHPDDLASTEERWRTSVETGVPYEVNFRLRRGDGVYRWHLGLAIPVRDQHEQILQWFGSSTDVSSSKQNEIELKDSERDLAAAQTSAKIGSWRRDLLTNQAVWSAEMYRIFEFDPNAPPPDSDTLCDRVHPDDRDKFNAICDPNAHAHVKGMYQLDFRYPLSNGETLWVESKNEAITNEHGTVIALCGTAQDITERKQIEQALHISRQLLAQCQAIAQIGGWEIDLRNRSLIWTEETYRIHDTTPDEFELSLDAGLAFFLPDSRDKLIQAMDAAIVTGQGYDLELEKYTVTGRKIDVRTTCHVTMHEGKAVLLTGIIQDITQQKTAQTALKHAYVELERSNGLLEHIAHYDALTHLPNRVLLADRMQQAMAQCQRRNNCLAVAFLDLDGFKAINDVYGHSVGDQLLIEIAARLRTSLREGDTLARLGGDEFVAILTDLDHSKDCEPVLARLLGAASEPVHLQGAQLQVSASIGVTLYPQDGVDAEQLLRHADQAMYLSKQAGKNCFHLFDVEHDAAIKIQRDDLSQIRQALLNREFVLFYQPKVNMRTGDIIGAEALIRWQHPTKDLLVPASFLPTVENHLFSIEIGEWVIATALEQMAQWQQSGLRIPVSVNVGALQLQQVDFTQRLQQQIAHFPHSIYSMLELEILETSALEDIEQISQVIHACQALGVSFALDDFGTGYSSLRYLKRLPAEMLKIDQSFVRDMLEDAGDLTIIKGVIGLAQAFHRSVIAEGVETVAHGDMLLSIGCELAQGYGIARPMPAAAVQEWIANWRSPFKK